MIQTRQAPPTTATATGPSFRCQNCGSARSQVRYRFSGVDKVIRECGACNLMVLDPLPTEEDLQAVYNEGYFENDQLTQSDVSKVYGYVDYISERINKQKGYAEVCRMIKQVVIPAGQPPRLLDYGCGLGFFLDTAYEAGFAVHGLEFNGYAIEYIRQRYAYPVAHYSELDVQARYDVITMFDVIEHLRDPFETLDLIRSMLTDTGIVVISTMDSTSVTSRLMGKRLEDFRRISEHLFFFSRSNLGAMLRQRGFDILKMASKGHSIELRLLATRLRAVMPIVGAPMVWLLSVLPFLGRWSLHVNPRTKFIVYARKRRTAAPATGRLSIVVPVYNEAVTVGEILAKLSRLDLGLETEIIAVDDGSTDGTREILADWSARGEIVLLSRPHRGKGAAVAAGIAASRGDYVIIQDADAEYDPADIPSLLQTMRETGSLAVYGSRYSGRFRRTGPFLATAGNGLLTLIANLVNNLNLSDVMTGYKLFDGNLVRSLRLTSSGFEIEAELTCRVSRKGVAIYEAPISYNARSYLEGKKVRIADGWRVLMTLLRYGLFRTD